MDDNFMTTTLVSAFLVVIAPLAILGLVLPNYTRATNDSSFSTAQAL